MTVPIMPGPWSFLAGAGQAAGAIGTAVTARKTRKGEEAQRGLANVMQLIQSGRLDPGFMNTPEVQHLLQVSGTPVPEGTVFSLTAEDLFNAARRRAYASLEPGGAAERALTRVPSEAVAGAGERTALAGAETAEVGVRTARAGATTAEAQAAVAAPRAAAQLRGEQAQATILQGEAATTPSKTELDIARNRSQADIYNGVIETLGAVDAQGRPSPASAQIRRIAEYAATGGLPYIIALLQRSASTASDAVQASIARATLGLNTLGLITKEAGDAAVAWDNGLERAMMANGAIAAATMAGTAPDETAVASVVNAYTSRHGRRPTFNSTRDALGLRTAQFGDVPGIITDVVAGGAGRGGRGVGAGGDIVNEITNWFISHPVEQSVTELTQMFNTQRLTGDNVRAIRNALTGKVPANILQGIDIVISHIGLPAATARPSAR